MTTEQPVAWYDAAVGGFYLSYESIPPNILKSRPIMPLYTHPAKTEQPSLSDEQVWDIYVKATNAVMNTGGRTFAIALTRAILAQRQDSNKDAGK